MTQYGNYAAADFSVNLSFVIPLVFQIKIHNHVKKEKVKKRMFLSPTAGSPHCVYDMHWQLHSS